MSSQIPRLLLVIFCVFPQFSRAVVDKTREFQATGEDVVDAVIRKIRRSDIFKDDYDFLKRAALIETNFGQNPDTFTDPNAAGIWKVTPSMLNITKSSKLKTVHEKILSKFDVDWVKVKWRDLDKPLINGIAFRLYLHALAPNLPQTIGKQEQLWKYIYQKKGPVSGLFVDKMSDFDDTAGKCRGLFDLTIVMDGSGSIGDEDFSKAKDFVINLFGTYSTESVRKAFVLFGDDAQMIFRLDNTLKTEELQEIVRNMSYPAEATNTNAGILMAVEMIKTSNPRQDGVPSIMLVFTDGESNVGDGVSNIKMAKQNNITSFAIGIGARLNQTELLDIAYNDASHLLLTKDFSTLKSLVNRINAETCLVSQKPDLGEEVPDLLFTDEYRYYEYPVDERGVRVTVNNTNGTVEGYYSFTEQNPSSAVYDGVLNSTTTIIQPPDDFWDKFTSTELESEPSPNTQIYITLQGRKKDNNYTIEVNPLNGPGLPKIRRKQNSTTSNTIGSEGSQTDGSNSDDNNSGSGSSQASGGNNSGSGNSQASGDNNSGSGSSQASGNQSGTSKDSTGLKNSSSSSSKTPSGAGDSSSNPSGSSSQAPSGVGGSSSGSKNPSSSPSQATSGVGGSPAPGSKNPSSLKKPGGSYGYDTPWPDAWEESGEADVANSGGSRGSADDERRRKPPQGISNENLNFGSPYTGNSKAPRCPERFIGFMAFPGRCDVYTLCTFGIRVLFECAPGLHFDRVLKACNFIQLANCDPDMPIPNLSRADVTV